jgi:hypothetical protein
MMSATFFMLIVMAGDAFYMGAPPRVVTDPAAMRVAEIEKRLEKLRDENVALRVRVEVLETKLNALSAARAVAPQSATMTPAPPINSPTPYRSYGPPTIIYDGEWIEQGPCRNGVCPAPTRRR